MRYVMYVYRCKFNFHSGCVGFFCATAAAPKCAKLRHTRFYEFMEILAVYKHCSSLGPH